MTMSAQIIVEQVLTASNTDFLAGTQLDQPGVPGVYTVWLACDAAASGPNLVTITLGGQQITSNAAIVLRTNAEIDQDEDVYFQMISPTGGRPVINVTEISAANIRVRVIFIPVSALR
jgi:hypothetical protein